MIHRLHGDGRAIEGILFDMDGVLVDSIPHHIHSWNHVFREHGLPDFDREIYFSALGQTNAEMLDAFCNERGITLDGVQKAEILLKKEEIFRENISSDGTTTPGVRTWLEFCHARGCLCAVASSSTMANITHVLSSLALEDYFSVLISGRHLPRTKPDPQIFLSAGAALGIAAESCLVIEDAPAGVAAAKSAQMACIAITTSYSRQLLKGADLILETLSEKEPEQILVPDEREV